MEWIKKSYSANIGLLPLPINKSSQEDQTALKIQKLVIVISKTVQNATPVTIETVVILVLCVLATRSSPLEVTPLIVHRVMECMERMLNTRLVVSH